MKNMDGFELISRQAVIDTLLDWAEHSITEAEEWHLRQVIGDIRSMPGERKQGMLVDLRDVLENYSDLYWNEGLLAFKDELDAVYENIRNLAK